MDRMKMILGGNWATTWREVKPTAIVEEEVRKASLLFLTSFLNNRNFIADGLFAFA